MRRWSNDKGKKSLAVHGMVHGRLELDEIGQPAVTLT